MRYLINLPLAFALAGLWLVFDTVVVSRPRGFDAALDAAFAALFGTFFTWSMLAVALVACGAMGTLRWPRARGAAGALIASLGFVAIVVLALQPLGMAMERDAYAMFGGPQATGARLVAFGLPLVLILYAAWLINAPASWHENPEVDRTAYGVVGLLCLLAAFVSVKELARQSAEAQAQAAAVARQAEQQAQKEAEQQRRNFAALTEADPLYAWDMYLSATVPDDIRAEATRRVAARPQLEAEIAQALASDNGNWSAEALSLIVRLPIKPSDALVQPVRESFAAFAAELTREARDASDNDTRPDSAAFWLDTMLQAAQRLAETTGADLGASLDAVARAVVLYPKSEAATWFPRRLAETKEHIAATPAARRP